MTNQMVKRAGYNTVKLFERSIMWSGCRRERD